MRAALHIVLVSLLLFAGIGNVDAARRMAFVVGIDDYQHIPKLKKAVGDANAMTAKLADLGFDVTPVLNPTRRALNIAVGEFTAKLRRDDLVFVHFSGHGVEIDGDNILLPADVPKPKSGQKFTIKYEGIGLRRLIDQISSTGARTRVFVIDACRDNPFEQAGVRAVGSSRGLARIEAPSGTFIMYSAGYRQKALDRLSSNDSELTSVYTRVLLNKLGAPGKPLASVAREVRNEVQTLASGVGHIQRPAYYDELSSRLVLKAALTGPVPSKPASTSLSADQKATMELAYWNSVKDTNRSTLLRSYLRKYPEGQFADIAKDRLSEKSQKPGPKKEKQTAALQPAPAAPVPAETKLSTNEAPALSKRELALRVQRQLVRLGCNPGRPDGVWGRRSESALRAFVRHGRVKLASLNPSQKILDLLSGKKVRICPLNCGKRQMNRNGRCVQKQCASDQFLTKTGTCVTKRKQNRTKPTKVQRKKKTSIKAQKKRTPNVVLPTRGRCPPGLAFNPRNKVCYSRNLK